jgi:hypothetical protein
MEQEPAELRLEQQDVQERQEQEPVQHLELVLDLLVLQRLEQ